MNDESRPKAAPETPAKKSAATVTRQADEIPVSAANSARLWASDVSSRMTSEAIARIKAATDAGLGPIPRYGSAEWHALPADDIRRPAAVMVAAEAWRDYCSAERVQDDMRDEIRGGRRAWLRDIAEAYRAGQESVRDASSDVGTATDWRGIVSELDNGRRARTRRAQLLDPRPRPGDFLGRAPSSRAIAATPAPDPYRCALCGEPVQPTQRALNNGFSTVCQRCDVAKATPAPGDNQRRA